MGVANRKPRIRRILSVLAVLVVVAALAGAWGFHANHPRDEAGFLSAVRQYPGVISIEEGGDLAAVTAAASTFTTPPRAMVAAGDRACGWLSDQPYAGLRTTDRFRVATLFDRYADATRSGSLG